MILLLHDVCRVIILLFTSYVKSHVYEHKKTHLSLIKFYHLNFIPTVALAPPFSHLFKPP